MDGDDAPVLQSRAELEANLTEYTDQLAQVRREGGGGGKGGTQTTGGRCSTLHHHHPFSLRSTPCSRLTRPTPSTRTCGRG